MTANEDFLFAQEAQALGFVTDAQVKEAFALQRRMSEDLRLDERLGVILVKRGYMAEDQARRVYARIEPKGAQPGQIVGYRLIEVVGRGAMGTVYRALHLGLNREVALKILRQDLAGDRTQVERLKAEAAMLASLDHPNIVRALDAGESNGFPYVAMEFVEGETLRDRLRRAGPLPEKEALRITRDLADALERARRMGVVHRDVKPGNVLIAKNGTPKLMDLGLAKGPIDLGLTQHGATVGTPQYIAPEQAIDPRKADTRSDIYGLGATLYAMLTGKPPFDGQTLAEILTKVLYEMPAPVRSLRPEVSPETGYLVERMMLRDPTLRYRTPALVVEDIDHLIQGNSILPAGFSGNWEAYLVRKRARRYALVGSVTMVAAVLLALGVHLVQGLVLKREARQTLEAKIETEMNDRVVPPDPRSSLEARLQRADDLLREAAQWGAASRPKIESRVRYLRGQIALLDELEAVKARSRDAEARGEFAAADRDLGRFVESVPVEGPARSQAKKAYDDVQARSDRAIGESQKAALPRPPKSLEGVASSLQQWAEALGSRFAPTDVRKNEEAAAVVAAKAARVLVGQVAAQGERVSQDVIASRVSRHEFQDLRRDLLEAASRAGADLEAALPDLTGTGPPSATARRTAPGVEYYSRADLEPLVSAPFEAARAAAERSVGEEAERVLSESDRLIAKGATPAALVLLQAFVDAAGKGLAFPAAAEQVRTALEQRDQQTREGLKDARAALNALLDALVIRLRAIDLPGYAALVAEARAKPALFRPVASALDDLERVPAAFEALYERAMRGLAAHVGADKAKWLDPVALRDGTTGRQWEIRGADSAARTFVVVAHKGGTEQPPRTWDLLDLADDEIVRLAGLSDDAKGDVALKALHALAMLPDPPADFYRRREQLRAVADLFAGAGQAGTALAAWVDARLDEARVAIDKWEVQAQDDWDSAQRRMAKDQYSDAYPHLSSLKEPPLVFTKVATANAAKIDAAVAEIRSHLAKQELALYLAGSRSEAQPSSTPDALDVDVLFDLNTPEQLDNFVPGTGLARLVPGGPGRVRTPDATGDMSLLLLPDNEGEEVKDGALVMEDFTEPGFERSVAFNYWPRQASFLGIDLGGVEVGVLSLDPQALPFPSDVPLLEHEKQAPRFNVYGRGRGVLFRAAPEMGDPVAWPWGDAYQGRHFLPKDIAVKERHEQLDRHWFEFEANREKPYRVKFTHSPEQGRVALFVDDREVWWAQGPEFRSPKPSGRIEILSFSTCLVDDIVISGRVSRAWLERMRARKGAKPVGGVVSPPAKPPR